MRWWSIPSPHVGNLPHMWPLLTIKCKVNVIRSLNICRSQGNVSRTIQESEGQYRLFHAYKATFISFIVGVRPVLFSQRDVPRNKESSTHSKNFSKYFMYRAISQGGGHFQNKGPKLRLVLHSWGCSPIHGFTHHKAEGEHYHELLKHTFDNEAQEGEGSYNYSLRVKEIYTHKQAQFSPHSQGVGLRTLLFSKREIFAYTVPSTNIWKIFPVFCVVLFMTIFLTSHVNGSLWHTYWAHCKIGKLHALIV